MEINVWSNFIKRKNSTLQPGSSGMKTISVRLKEETNILSPSFIISEPMPNYTYCRAFGNYYFVEDVKNLDSSRAEIICNLDPLATYRSSILSYNAFVERSASNYDKYLADPALSSQQKYIADQRFTTSLSDFMDPEHGCYIIPVLTKTGGHAIYCSRNLKFLQIILNSGCYDADDIRDWITSKISASFDLDVYIGAIKWMPLKLTSLGPPLPNSSICIGPVVFKPEGVPDGTYIVPVSATAATGVRIHLTLPAAYYNDFRDADPSYTIYSITLPGVGTVPLDSAFVGSCILNNINVYDQMAIDISTGLVTHIIETGISASVKFCNFKGSLAVDVPIGKARANTVETLTTFIGGESKAIGNLVGGGGTNAGNVVSGVGTALVTGLQTIKSAYCPQVSMSGGSGNHYDLYLNSGAIHINRKVFGSKQFPLSVAGRPLMQYATLGSLSGYVKCGNASVPVNAYDQVRNDINAYLNSGVYIE